MRTWLTKQEKTTDIWFDEKDPLIHIRTHNTDLKNRLTAYSRRYPAICKLTDEDAETGCLEFEIRKGRFSFRLTAPYNEERRAGRQAKRRKTLWQFDTHYSKRWYNFLKKSLRFDVVFATKTVVYR